MSIKLTLQGLKKQEDDLRRKIVLPMMWALKCTNVRDNQGSNEKGKDIIYSYWHPVLRKEANGSIVLKSINIGKPQLGIMAQQIHESYTPFPDPKDPNDQIRLREIILMTPFDFTKDAREYIFEKCCNALPNMHFVNGDTMERLINSILNEHYEKKGIMSEFEIDSFLEICEAVSGRKIPIFSETKRETGEGGEVAS